MSDDAEILVIDDSATIRKLVEMSVRGTSLRARFSASGADGLAEARRLQPSAILLDCVLPDSSGQQICSQLAADERTRSIPILLVTAKPESVRDEFRDYASVVDFIAKPFTGPDLVRRIRRALAGSAVKQSPSFDRGYQERAAKVLYARLRDGLAMLPALTSKIGTSPPGPFLAKRLLTPEVVAAILEDLSNLVDEARAAHPHSEGGEPLQPHLILDRASGFSARVQQVVIDGAARRILTLVNGRNTIQDIAARSGIDVRQVGTVSRELVARGLLEDRSSAAAARARARPVVILEPDVQGFQRPFASLLEARPEAPALVAVASVLAVVTTVRRVRPCLVVVNATGESGSVGNAARELRADSRFADVALVAILDRFQQSDRDEVYSAGFDAVLS